MPDDSPGPPPTWGAVVLRDVVPRVRWREGGGSSSFCLETPSDGLLSPSTDGAGAEAHR